METKLKIVVAKNQKSRQRALTKVVPVHAGGPRYQAGNALQSEEGERGPRVLDVAVHALDVVPVVGGRGIAAVGVLPAGHGLQRRQIGMFLQGEEGSRSFELRRIMVEI